MQDRKAAELINAALLILKERGEIYGDANDHYYQLARLQGAYEDAPLTRETVVMRNVLEKLDRARRAAPGSPTFRDSLIDAINYIALAWEVSG